MTNSAPSYLRNLGLDDKTLACATAGDAAYNAVRYEHSLYADSGLVCKCGQTFRRTQAFGQHLGAADRRAQKAWDAAYAAKREELGK
ncbi:hypothetical protein SEA_CEN1621_22 [Microbacterium phage Cen1621]|uniref:Uncharacterized protein n=1 Tax=Microbacterium phage Cen1621 TaxID=2965191 RepID=A0A9E7TQW1_9CAUD|nr:hypothetical protein SEA_CEN1621_22 [Microbacterium phage Cen1621]